MWLFFTLSMNVKINAVYVGIETDHFSGAKILLICLILANTKINLRKSVKSSAEKSNKKNLTQRN
jgi:hypothetical protein